MTRKYNASLVLLTAVIFFSTICTVEASTPQNRTQNYVAFFLENILTYNSSFVLSLVLPKETWHGVYIGSAKPAWDQWRFL